MAKKFKHSVDGKPKSLWKGNGFETTPAGNAFSKEIQDAVEPILNAWADKGYKLNEVRQIAGEAVNLTAIFVTAFKATE